MTIAGTWQPAYDLRTSEAKCERFNFTVSLCDASIRSVANPDQAPITFRYMMLFASGGGEAMVPVRSTADRTAVSIFYPAVTKLRNRTLSFIFAAGLLALFCASASYRLVTAINS